MWVFLRVVDIPRVLCVWSFTHVTFMRAEEMEIEA